MRRVACDRIEISIRTSLRDHSLHVRIHHLIVTVIAASHAHYQCGKHVAALQKKENC
jgi:hypothetical protein